jgi:dipeptidyl aminopeptidase/acylaminoacyl peptidase
MLFEKQIVAAFKGNMYTRCDDTETVFYFSSKDFPGLKAEPHSFKSSMGHDLKGYLYEYDNATEGRLIVFDHGFGGGHQAYMKEIELLCKKGYKVFAYDHTGCMESGGESPNGLAQSLCDLNDCIAMLKADPRYAGYGISVIGHSWGAFSTLNISALHPDISHIVAISGFVSVSDMISTFFSGIMKGYRAPVMALERESNPKFVDYNGVESLKASKTKALLIYSENDHLCKREHYDILKAGLEGRENLDFLFVQNKGHNPNYTEDAVKYLNEFVSARTKLLSKKKLSDKEKADFVSSFDWNRMTEQDETVWNKIFAHLEA